VLELPWVDAHDGWLIFALPPAELGVHPAGTPGDPKFGAPSGHHELVLDVRRHRSHRRGAHGKGRREFTAPIENQGFGLLTRLRVPGAGEISLYQPRHATAYDLDR